jgi:hypothetical protein
MQDKRNGDRRKKDTAVKTERRKGQRRLVCDCGGRIEPVIGPENSESFVCLRCGKKH